ncbi:hypothetical protein OIU76_030242 [Salix suchowensis]|nr:hypothetical protein OIU76_030242 [Salix suchowensis]
MKDSQRSLGRKVNADDDIETQWPTLGVELQDILEWGVRGWGERQPRQMHMIFVKSLRSYALLTCRVYIRLSHSK